MFQEKVVEEIKTHTSRPVLFFENCAFYVITWKNTVEPTGHRKDPEKMVFACRIPKTRI